MKKLNTNQEVLLMPGTSFFKKDWCEKNSSAGKKKISQKDQLIELCWNGVLPGILPEILETSDNNKALTLWEINETDNLLDLRFGETNQVMNDEWSINPYIFLELVELS